MIRLEDNPPICWPEATLSSDGELVWTPFYTKPRQEKSLAWDLVERKVAYFLPMVVRETSSGGRRRRNLYPLFPSYLFVAGGDVEQLSALKTNRIVRRVDVEPAAQPTLQRELAALELALRTFPDSLELHPRLVPGAAARIRSGPMAGVEGIVVGSGARRRLLLSVSCLGVGATVEIHPDLVEAL